MFVTAPASARSGQAALASGPAGQMIAAAAITKIGAQVDGGGLGRCYSFGLAGKTLFLAADGEAGAHGVDLAAPHGTGKQRFPPCRAAVGRGTIRRMVEGLVGLGARFPVFGDYRRAVLAAAAPPSCLRHATSPWRKMFRIILAAMDEFGGLRGASGLWEDSIISRSSESCRRPTGS